jgi:hypothetical protein
MLQQDQNDQTQRRQAVNNLNNRLKNFHYSNQFFSQRDKSPETAQQQEKRPQPEHHPHPTMPSVQQRYQV